MKTNFTELGLNPALLQALSKQSITQPTAIQLAAIPLLLTKNDLYIQAETGTGKTLSYLLPLFSRINPLIPNAQVMILAPTHELAIQIQTECTELSQHSGLPIRVASLIGGASFERQLEKLKKKPHIIVGSPGRIREIIEARKLKTHLVHTIVMDEADRLLNPEKLPDIEAIIKTTHSDRSLIFVSATNLPARSETLHALSPNLITVHTAKNPVNTDIEHFYLRCAERDKAESVRKLIRALSPARSIVFVHKNDDAELIAHKLAHHKMSVVDIHGAMDKEERKTAMERIRNGSADILIASDVAARGLDIKGVTHVFNLDIPSHSDDYLHRVGRTGRAGTKGVSISLISGDQLHLLERFTKDLGIILTEVQLRDGEVHEVSLGNTLSSTAPNQPS